MDNSLRARWILAASSVLLVVGWFAPAYKVSRGLGDPLLNEVVDWVFPELLRSTEKSLCETMLILLTSGTVGSICLGLIIVVFTFIFPVLKFVLLFTRTLECSGMSSTARWLCDLPVSSAGKWSMLDVLVVAVIAVSLGEFQGLISVTIGWGTIAFCLSVIGSIVATNFVSESPPKNSGTASKPLEIPV